MPNITARTTYRFATLGPDAVFEAWTHPGRVRKWMARSLDAQGGPYEITRIAIDPQVGGRYLFAGTQGGEQSDSWGYYREFVPGRRLVFTWFVEPVEEEADNSTVTLDLEGQDDGCRAVMAHEMDAQWADYADRTANAWHSMLKAIDETFG